MRSLVPFALVALAALAPLDLSPREPGAAFPRSTQLESAGGSDGAVEIARRAPPRRLWPQRRPARPRAESVAQEKA